MEDNRGLMGFLLGFIAGCGIIAFVVGIIATIMEDDIKNLLLSLMGLILLLGVTFVPLPNDGKNQTNKHQANCERISGTWIEGDASICIVKVQG